MEIINELIGRLRDMLELCHKKNRELDAAKKAIADDRSAYEADRASLDTRLAEVQARENKVGEIEVGIAYRQESDRLRTEVAKEREALNAERVEFNKHRESENKKIVDARTSLDQSWKDLNARSAKLESELNARVEEFLKKLKK